MSLKITSQTLCHGKGEKCWSAKEISKPWWYFWTLALNRLVPRGGSSPVASPPCSANFRGSLLFRMCRDVAAPAGSRLQNVPGDIARSRIAFISLCQKMLMFPVLSQMRRDRVPPGVERWTLLSGWAVPSVSFPKKAELRAKSWHLPPPLKARHHLLGISSLHAGKVDPQ